ncbi:MAG: histidine--tRNA ligase [Proteiniphilum sp.]|nr:histidine--tRNA ligase [Proteiniphilum sp.]MDD4800822.1 histidine--tRNA ligase [Proteiniphilum sp.]
MQKPTIPKGTRDFSPEETAKRNYIFDTISKVYRLYGFRQIETPAMENLSTLMGKYGEEGDKLLFKILNSGDFLSSISGNDLKEGNAAKTATRISEKGLRYDLTVPFARYVVMHRNEISFPFRRYQIQPVWRADRPQKGRYREFFQCDADIVGSDSLLNEVELVQIIDEVFGRLGIRVSVKLNNRKILSGIAEIIGEADKITDITVAIDKLDKIGLEKVNEELAAKGIAQEAIDRLQPIILLSGSTDEKLEKLRELLATSESGTKGVEEMAFIFGKMNVLKLRSEIVLDLTLARGLNYYTGAIIEVKALDAEMGSITGGGRYDNLTGIFGLPGVSGVGISFGADRIYDVLTQLELFPESFSHTTELLFVNFGERETDYLLPLVAQLRREGICCELYPEAAKMKRQLSYADSNRIPWVAMVGENEIKEGTVTLKNMQSGEQKSVPPGELAKMIR